MHSTEAQSARPLNRRSRLALALLLVCIASAPAPAQTVELEADPLAYALNGFSLHLAGIFGGHRLSIGTFGLDVPGFFHGNEGWKAAMRGVGVKWDLLGRRLDGFFVGADAGYFRMAYTLESTATRTKRDELGLGLRGGYRLPIGRAGFYLAPWVGLGYTFGGGDVAIGEEVFSSNALTAFPTVHLGWRF